MIKEIEKEREYDFIRVTKLQFCTYNNEDNNVRGRNIRRQSRKRTGHAVSGKFFTLKLPLLLDYIRGGNDLPFQLLRTGGIFESKSALRRQESRH